MNEQYLTFRGAIRSLVTVADMLAFVTEHPDQTGHALYLLDPAKPELRELPLPAAGRWVLARENQLVVATSENQLYTCSVKDKQVASFGKPLDAPASLGSWVNSDEILLASGKRLSLIQASDGKQVQSWETEEDVSAFAADPTGSWLAIGSSKGYVTTFQRDEDGRFQPSETGKLHDAEVTALLFEPEELRFLSAGADQRLLLTHAQGKLEPEDRGKSVSHKDRIVRLLQSSSERFLTVSRDKTCKTWAFAGGTRPSTLEKGVPACVDGTIVELHERPHLAVAGADNTLRLFLLDAGGKFSDATHRFYDAYATAQHQLGKASVVDRGESVSSLASYADTRSLKMLSEVAWQDVDPNLRRRAAELLGKASQPVVETLLVPLLKHEDAKLRLSAFSSLLELRPKGDLRSFEQALASQQKNIGLESVRLLEALAKKDDSARQLLVQSLDSPQQDIRYSALLALEAIFAKTAPDAGIIAAKAKQADVRRLALIRFFQRKQLSHTRVQAVVRRLAEDADADVRHAAFLTLVLSATKLATALRQRDKELHRQLHEIESHEILIDSLDRASESKPQKQEAKKGSGSDKELKQPKKTKLSLSPEEYEPLLIAMSSSTTDTCLQGANALAILEDSRAFGTLLQLSREKATKLRVQVARSLASLGDSRAVQRLNSMLDDSAAEVRDAAFGALLKLEKEDPLAAADAGLASSHADTRGQALQTLVKQLRKSKSKAGLDLGQAMLLQFLNDEDEKVRNEAFKSALNLEIAGGVPETLRFILESAHASVRREVLTEAMANEQESWSADLLLDLLSDANDSIRLDAYEHLNRKSKGKNVTSLSSGLGSQYADLRLTATQRLAKLNNADAQEALLGAIHDEERDVRITAINALASGMVSDVLRQAIDSQHTDVRIAAATALAKLRDPEAAQVLLEELQAPEPETRDDRALWKEHVLAAMMGLKQLRSDEAMEPLLEFIHGDDEQLASAAAKAIAQRSQDGKHERLVPLLQHQREDIRVYAALGLALNEQEIAKPLLYSQSAGRILSQPLQLVAACAFGDGSENQLAELLDTADGWVADAALLTLLARDLLKHNGSPRRLLLALSAESERVRLWAARALECFVEPEEFVTVLVEFVEAQEREETLSMESDLLLEILQVVVFGEARLAGALEALNASSVEAIRFQWESIQQCWIPEMEEAKQNAAEFTLPKPTAATEELKALAFGTYVGLVRSSTRSCVGGSSKSYDVRQAAMRRLVLLAKKDAQYVATVQPVLLQALSHSQTEIRMLAFELLAELGCDDQRRAEAALDSGHTDLAIAGLKLLSAGDSKQGVQVLRDVLKDSSGSLAMECTQLLMELVGAADAANDILECHWAPARELVLHALGREWDDDMAAQTALRNACDSRFNSVQLTAATLLAQHKDKTAFEQLSRLLRDPASGGQQRIVAAMVQLAHPDTSLALLDRIVDDPSKTAKEHVLFGGLQQLRDTSVAPRLMELVADKEVQGQAIKTIVAISGFDQRPGQIDEDFPDWSWLETQFPRHEELLAELISTLNDLGLIKNHIPLLHSARWTRGNAVDSALEKLVLHPESNVRDVAVEYIGFRAKYRGSKSDVLVSSLEHQDANTRFVAACGLASVGRNEGASILLSAVELLPDLRQRQRAVIALGELSDPRAWDLLLRLVCDDGHALQESAAEAIGHLGTTDRAEEVFDILKPMAQRGTERAIHGLRWLNTPLAWELVREQAEKNNCEALEVLAHDDSPETRDLLLRYLASHSRLDHWRQVDVATKAARRLFGEESLEPAYAVLSGDIEWDALPQKELLDVCERGEPERMLPLLKTPVEEIRAPLLTSLLARDKMPVQAALGVLDSKEPGIVAAAARVLGWAPLKPKLKDQPLLDALSHWNAESNHLLGLWQQGGHHERMRLDAALDALCNLIWALGRHQIGRKELLQLLASNTGEDADEQCMPIALAVLNAVRDQKLTKAELKTVADLQNDRHSSIRMMVAEILSKQANEQVSELTMASMSDRALVHRTRTWASEETAESAASAASSLHHQGNALAVLVEEEDLSSLTDVAQAEDLPDLTRSGALEAIAKLATLEAEEALVAIATRESNSEELCKTAWRALRRSKRLRAKKEAS